MFLVPILFCVLAFLLYRGSAAMRIFLSAMIYALFNAVLYLCEFTVMFFAGLDRAAFVENRLLYTGATLAGMTLILAAVLLLKYFHQPYASSWTWAVLVAFFPLTTVLVLFLLYQALAATGAELMNTAAKPVLGCLVTMAIANVVVLMMVDWMQKAAADREKEVALSEHIHGLEESVAALSDAYARQRKLAHDIHNHTDVLAHLLDAGQTEQAIAYVHDLQQTQTERILLVKTHNASLDALLNLKAYTAQQNKIDLHFEANNLAQLPINQTDYTAVLGNLLDNAMEACAKLPEDQRWIRVRIVLQNTPSDTAPVLLISVQNSSLPVKIVRGKIATSKQDRTGHGYGLAIVQDILRKYGAEFAMHYEEGFFLFSIEWPCKKI